MNPQERNPYLEAFRKLAVTRGLSLAGLTSGRHSDFVVITAAATLVFATGRDYNEREVNALLVEWLAGPGVMLAADHVELRRTLVDCRLLRRDDYGRRYGRGAAPHTWQAALVALAGVDLAAEARAARTADARRRAERKARWERRVGHAALSP